MKKTYLIPAMQVELAMASQMLAATQPLTAATLSQRKTHPGTSGTRNNPLSR